MMGRLSFADAVYLLLMGELPTPAIGRMLNAMLVSSLDHGVTPPSTLAARNVATSGAPLKDCVAAGILAFGPHHGGDIESCMRFLDQRADAGARRRVAAGGGRAARRRVPRDSGRRRPASATGFTRAIRGRRGCSRWRSSSSSKASTSSCCARSSARSTAREERVRAPLPVNVDGAIAAICADLGFAYELGNAIFLISRLPGLIAHAHEERTRQQPMRQIDPKDHEYDGSRERRLPEGRK